MMQWRVPPPIRLWHQEPKAGCAPVLTSAVSSAELWLPCTMLRVQCERSLLTSALKRCVSIPCWVPVRVAKDRSTPAWGDPFPGPEWTSLLRRRGRNDQNGSYGIHLTRHLRKSSSWWFAWIALTFLIWNPRIQDTLTLTMVFCPLLTQVLTRGGGRWIQQPRAGHRLTVQTLRPKRKIRKGLREQF